MPPAPTSPLPLVRDSPAPRSRSRSTARSATSARPLPDGATVAIVTDRSDESLELIRHDTAHVLAAAVMDLYPGVKISIGPPIENGFYYDFEFPDGVTISEGDLPAIEAKMAEHISADEHFAREDVTSAEARERFVAEGQPYKVELIDDLGVDSVSLYTNGPFTDLCRGPHAPSTKRIKAFKLLSTAGAYWRGNSDNTMLTRIYGTAFHSKKDLEEHLERLEQARARDHRRIGPQLGLFQFSEISPGSAFWLPKGTQVFNTLVQRSREMTLERGYDEVKTPLLYDSSLWETSGHWGKYRENMFTTEYEDRSMGLKPMNCPGHAHLFSLQRWSYRDLPFRCAEPGLLHRREPSGTLHGLLRVRHFIQDDAHIFCTEEQVEEEVLACVQFGFDWYDAVRLRHHPRALHPPGEPDRLGRVLGQDGGHARRRARQGRPRVPHQRGRRRLLRAQDRHARDRLARPLLAARHGAARLQPARALRPHLHGRRQRRAPARDDPPRAAGLLRALHRDPARGDRRRAAGLARARAGEGPRPSPTATTTYARGPRRRAEARQACASDVDDRSESDRAARSATPSCRRSRSCSSWATASRSPARRHAAPPRRRRPRHR